MMQQQTQQHAAAKSPGNRQQTGPYALPIAVIGAGPAGAQAAFDLAQAGRRVLLIEDHHCVGEPVACTGLLTSTITELLDKKEFEESIVNELHGVDIVAPSGRKTRIPLHEFVVDRIKFDRLLVDKAVRAGATLLTGHRFIGRKRTREGNIMFLRHNGHVIQHDVDAIIGADGPLSAVAQSAGLMKRRKSYIGMQATVATTKAEFDKEVFTTWFGKIAPGFFAWSVPENSATSRIGLAAMANTREHFEALLKRFNTTPQSAAALQAGPIPLYNPYATASDPHERVWLVGDAAGLVKATTGGGIISGMRSASLAARAILNNENYEALLGPLRRELLIHLVIRRALNRFNDSDYDALISMMENTKVKAILKEHTREYPSRFILKLVKAEPKLLRFVPKGMISLFA